MKDKCLLSKKAIFQVFCLKNGFFTEGAFIFHFLLKLLNKTP